MKKLSVILLVLLSVLSACQKSTEDKIGDLIVDHMSKSLLHPESYEGVETEIDSAFAPCDSPEFYEKTLKSIKVGIDIFQLEEKAKHAKYSMSLLSGSHLSAFDQNEYNEAKEEYEQANSEKRKAKLKVQNLVDELKKEIAKDSVFIGLKARHKYRVNNNAGQTVFGETMFLFNEDLSKVVAVYDMNSLDYQIVMLSYKIMRDEE